MSQAQRNPMSRRAFCQVGAALALCADAAMGAHEPAFGVEDTPAADEPVKVMAFSLDTIVSLTAYGVDADVAEDVLAMCDEFEALFSAHAEGTDIWRVNHSAGEPCEVDPRTAELIGEGLVLGDDTDGIFDISIGAVSLLWDFTKGVKPDDDVVAEAIKHVDYRKVHVDGNTVTLEDPEARLDLGGLAKGWICTRMVGALRDAGATSALLSLGTSTIYALGSKPGGKPWRVGLNDPQHPGEGYVGVVELADSALTSSGLYDRQFELDGVRYWHILDPRTGYPLVTDVMGSTILGGDPTRADALATTLFARGMEGSLEWMDANEPELGAYVIDDEGEALWNERFQEEGNYAPVTAGGAS